MKLLRLLSNAFVATKCLMTNIGDIVTECILIEKQSRIIENAFARSRVVHEICNSHRNSDFIIASTPVEDHGTDE